jgi:hypothetical protein
MSNESTETSENGTSDLPPNGHATDNEAALHNARLQVEAAPSTTGETPTTFPRPETSSPKRRKKKRAPQDEGTSTNHATRDTQATEPAEHAAEAPADVTEAATEMLRLRAKVWTDPQTAKRYLMPTAFMRDVVRGQPVTDAMYAYALRDDDTKLVALTVPEWNALPFHYFQEDGPAPRASARPPDEVP